LWVKKFDTEYWGLRRITRRIFTYFDGVS